MVTSQILNRVEKEGDPDCEHLAVEWWYAGGIDNSLDNWKCDLCGQEEYAPRFPTFDYGGSFKSSIVFPPYSIIRHKNEQKYIFKANATGQVPEGMIHETQQISHDFIDRLKFLGLALKIVEDQ